MIIHNADLKSFHADDQEAPYLSPRGRPSAPVPTKPTVGNPNPVLVIFLIEHLSHTRRSYRSHLQNLDNTFVPRAESHL